MSYKLISKYRNELMGVALLWVILFHSCLPDFKSDSMYIKIIEYGFAFIKKTGYGGVDIFLLLSSFGLFYSLSSKKEFDLKEFYRKRLLRIMPTFICITLLYSIYLMYNNRLELIGVIYNVTTISYWFNMKEAVNWYIPSILVFYLLTPVYYTMFISKKKKELLTLTVCIIGFGIGLIAIGMKAYYLVNFLARIPIFFIGFLIGYYSKNNIEIKKSSFILYMLSLMIGLLILGAMFTKIKNPYFRDYPFILITIPLSLLLAFIMEKLSLKYINSTLAILGKYSLEVYLLNVIFTREFATLNKYFVCSKNLILYNVVVFMLTIIGAIIINKIISKFISQ
ncbi:acyltransferase family protein [Clostridium butyricum]|uniref:acyltransferase family protein n=1 Tax=Clostridium butyricum TaxID=1492 RepID=UPI00136ECAF1|nr:acyltransferase [Clostridium butyricum]MZI80707.1 acyltransferase family protein [Clostridium butyricum]